GRDCLQRGRHAGVVLDRFLVAAVGLQLPLQALEDLAARGVVQVPVPDAGGDRDHQPRGHQPDPAGDIHWPPPFAARAGGAGGGVPGAGRLVVRTNANWSAVSAPLVSTLYWASSRSRRSRETSAWRVWPSRPIAASWSARHPPLSYHPSFMGVMTTAALRLPLTWSSTA